MGAGYNLHALEPSNPMSYPASDPTLNHPHQWRTHPLPPLHRPGGPVQLIYSNHHDSQRPPTQTIHHHHSMSSQMHYSSVSQAADRAPIYMPPFQNGSAAHYATTPSMMAPSPLVSVPQSSLLHPLDISRAPVLRPIPSQPIPSTCSPAVSSTVVPSASAPMQPVHIGETEVTAGSGSQDRRGVLPSASGRAQPYFQMSAPPVANKALIAPQKNSDGKFTCEACPKVYLHAKHLKRHMLRHTGDRPYMCILCRDTFSRSDILKRHFQKCCIRRGNPDNLGHLSHPQAHVKKNAAILHEQASQVHPHPPQQQSDLQQLQSSQPQTQHRQQQHEQEEHQHQQQQLQQHQQHHQQQQHYQQHHQQQQQQQQERQQQQRRQQQHIRQQQQSQPQPQLHQQQQSQPQTQLHPQHGHAQQQHSIKPEPGSDADIAHMNGIAAMQYERMHHYPMVPVQVQAPESMNGFSSAQISRSDSITRLDAAGDQDRVSMPGVSNPPMQAGGFSSSYNDASDPNQSFRSYSSSLY